MKLRGALRPVIVLLAGVALASTVAVAPAHAGIIRGYDFRTPFSAAGGDGAAKLDGSVEWFNRRTFSVWGRVNDLCPADGWSADGWVRIYYKDGNVQNYSLAWDRDGCHTNPENYYDRYARQRRIVKIRLKICEADWHDVRLVCRYRFRDNPFTG